ncbi:fumarylacetoacetate hydrolase family protein [Anthocerotibacter panamensis]|uniref:fumarylacetoacetate hydrolase family protein n=1 Tax=Anthocerotibacter panamensis TaxID=2857077 RepID=UPI001FD8FE8A|nr:fumarylacetoacetate hydrolase family protein [Anthocerotibacter panamensis]
MLTVRFQRRVEEPSSPTPVQHGVWEDDHIQTATESFTLDEVTLLPPCQPTKIIGVGKNYADHAQEMGGQVPAEPLLFLKVPSSLTAPGQPIVLPQVSQMVHYEGELAVVIGKLASRVPIETAQEYIAGYTCGNDVTARDFQRKDNQWTRAKGFDSFCPLGPCLRPGPLDPATRLETRLNGKIVQSAPISQMVFSPYFLVAYISQIMTLYPGDVILTGTPAGVGSLSPGDLVNITIEGIGTLTNPVISGP